MGSAKKAAIKKIADTEEVTFLYFQNWRRGCGWVFMPTKITSRTTAIHWHSSGYDSAPMPIAERISDNHDSGGRAHVENERHFRDNPSIEIGTQVGDRAHE